MSVMVLVQRPLGRIRSWYCSYGLWRLRRRVLKIKSRNPLESLEYIMVKLVEATKKD